MLLRVRVPRGKENVPTSDLPNALNLMDLSLQCFAFLRGDRIRVPCTPPVTFSLFTSSFLISGQYNEIITTRTIIKLMGIEPAWHCKMFIMVIALDRALHRFFLVHLKSFLQSFCRLSLLPPAYKYSPWTYWTKPVIVLHSASHPTVPTATVPQQLAETPCFAQGWVCQLAGRTVFISFKKYNLVGWVLNECWVQGPLKYVPVSLGALWASLII